MVDAASILVPIIIIAALCYLVYVKFLEPHHVFDKIKKWTTPKQKTEHHYKEVSYDY